VIGGLAIQIQATGRHGGRQTSARNTGNCLVGIDIHAAGRDHKQKAGDKRKAGIGQSEGSTNLGSQHAITGRLTGDMLTGRKAEAPLNSVKNG
jgi:hypothetical protein